MLVKCRHAGSGHTWRFNERHPMKILLAADGSKFTKKALAFVVNHEALLAEGGELVVLNVQAPVPPRVKVMAGAGVVAAWHRDEAKRVLEPIERFLARHAIATRYRWVVGHASQEIVGAAARDKAHMIVMGTHGHGLVARALMGSVAQKVVVDAPIPVLLVK
jgi:nucleotide-binding universal stress UspA family protein